MYAKLPGFGNGVSVESEKTNVMRRSSLSPVKLNVGAGVAFHISLDERVNQMLGEGWEKHGAVNGVKKRSKNVEVSSKQIIENSKKAHGGVKISSYLRMHIVWISPSPLGPLGRWKRVSTFFTSGRLSTHSSEAGGKCLE